MATLSSAAGLPTSADIPSLAASLAEQSAAIQHDLDALVVEAKACGLLTDEARSLQQIVAVVGQAVEIARIVGLHGPGVEGLSRLAAELERQLAPLNRGAEELGDAFASTCGRIASLRPMLDRTLIVAADAPVRAPGALIALHQIEARPAGGDADIDPSVLQARRDLANRRAEEIATEVTAWAAVLRDWVKDLVSLRIANSEVLLACRTLRRHMIVLSEKDVRTLSRIGALADQASAVAGAVQLLKEAVRGPETGVLKVLRRQAADAVQEVLDAALEATIATDAFAALAERLSAVARHVSERWLPGVDADQAQIGQRLADTERIQERINWLLTDELQRPSPPPPAPPPPPPPPPREPSFWEKIGGLFSGMNISQIRR